MQMHIFDIHNTLTLDWMTYGCMYMLQVYIESILL